jgi:transposase InsO family protein
MCRVLSVKLSSYYDWKNRYISEQQIHRNHCELLVKAAHSGTKERYGIERLHAKLIEQGHDISLYMVRRIKEEHGIKCRRHRRFKVTTDSNHNKMVYPNVLDQQFDAKRPNDESWVSDITYIWTSEGWLYLAGVKDLYTKEVVGYAINKRMTADLVCRALNMAINDIICYIELYYNQTRIQKGLGYRSSRQMWFDFYRQAA